MSAMRPSAKDFVCVMHWGRHNKSLVVLQMMSESPLTTLHFSYKQPYKPVYMEDRPLKYTLVAWLLGLCEVY